MHKYCPELTHPVDTLFHVAPCMGLTLLPAAVLLEGRKLVESHIMATEPAHSGAVTVALVLAGSLIAFGVVMSEFLLVRSTSSVTLSIAGICKELCTISIAVLLAGETLTTLNVCGLVVSILGIAYYNVLKFRGLATVGGHGRPYTKLSDENADIKVGHA